MHPPQYCSAVIGAGPSHDLPPGALEVALPLSFGGEVGAYAGVRGAVFRPPVRLADHTRVTTRVGMGTAVQIPVTVLSGLDCRRNWCGRHHDAVPWRAQQSAGQRSSELVPGEARGQRLCRRNGPVPEQRHKTFGRLLGPVDSRHPTTVTQLTANPPSPSTPLRRTDQRAASLVEKPPFDQCEVWVPGYSGMGSLSGSM